VAPALIPDVLREARRPLCIGIGGGGDVVGALATAEHCRIAYGARPVLGGVTWERRPIDPEPGPRAADEIENARPLDAAEPARGPGTPASPAVLFANARTRVRGSGVRFAEARMAELLGEETVLVDVGQGPAAVADGVGQAAAELGCDVLVFVDVGGDVRAHGDEPGLASPLCDAIMLAAAVRMAGRTGPAVMGAVFGIGCDGELTPDEVLARLREVDDAGGLLGRLEMTEAVARRLADAVQAVPTEASALALSAFRGESGRIEIRGGRRHVDLRPVASATTFFDASIAARSAARLAPAVRDAPDLEAANEALRGRGIRTELDYERDAARAV
jgi:hypothetical protein